MEDKIQQIKLEELHDFQNHPYRVEENEELRALAKSISENGVLSPAMARPRKEGGYELISGHRRKAACLLAGLDTMPVIVRELDNNEAVIIMVDSNTQREHILPSEKAFAYKMKLDAIKKQGKKTESTSRQTVGRLERADIIGAGGDESGRQVQRYIRLTKLISRLLEMVDGKEIAFNPAVELSYLPKNLQEAVVECIRIFQCTPSFAQAVRMKKLYKQGELDEGRVFCIMEEQKANQKEKITFMVHEIKPYFPKGWKADRMKKYILGLLQENPVNK
ncbi:ParB/RepB/Spo0J family partition protein [Oscillospiraceae bacterium OttesenSCG-928-F05]|nr:ParB/RepB/Spo0J family partition protein [Oscillospiraceae bacterium OttesenSCG-928-F05]